MELPSWMLWLKLVESWLVQVIFFTSLLSHPLLSGRNRRRLYSPPRSPSPEQDANPQPGWSLQNLFCLTSYFQVRHPFCPLHLNPRRQDLSMKMGDWSFHLRLNLCHYQLQVSILFFVVDRWFQTSNWSNQGDGPFLTPPRRSDLDTLNFCISTATSELIEEGGIMILLMP